MKNRQKIYTGALFVVFISMVISVSAQEQFSKSNDKGIFNNDKESLDHFIDLLSGEIDKQELQFKSENLAGMMIDSVHELHNKGLYFESKKSFYYYDAINRLDHIFSYYYDRYNRYNNIQETSIFNADEQLQEITTTQKITDPDTSLITYTEQNIYEKGLKIKRLITFLGDIRIVNGRLYYNQYDRIELFDYNSKSQLIHSVEPRFSNGNNMNMIENYYVYLADGRLSFQYENLDAGQYRGVKYFYNNEADSYSVLERNFDFLADDASAIDTQSVWIDGFDNEYLLDENGRIKEVIRSYRFFPSDTVLNYFKAQYEYTAKGELRKATYFQWDKNALVPAWIEKTQINRTYDEFDNLLVDEMSFIDLRLNKRVIDTRLTYYYNYSKSIDLDENKEVGEMHIYPNPAIDHLIIDGDKYENSCYTIYNLSGQALQQGRVLEGSVNVKELKSDTYFLNIVYEEYSKVFRFVKL